MMYFFVLVVGPHWTCQGESVLPLDYNARPTLRCKVFSDLWEKGYYITSGEKFGGDYLVYPGDPLKFHSHFIAVCVEEHQMLTPVSHTKRPSGNKC